MPRDALARLEADFQRYVVCGEEPPVPPQPIERDRDDTDWVNDVDLDGLEDFERQRRQDD